MGVAARARRDGRGRRQTGWLPQHLTLWEGEELVGACPLYVKAHSQGEFVFDHGWATAAHRARIPYYPKLLVGVPFTPVTGPRILAAPGRTATVAAGSPVRWSEYVRSRASRLCT